MAGSERPQGPADRSSLKSGTITRLVAQRKDPTRVSVFIDDAFAFGVHQDLVGEHRMARGDVLTADEQLALVQADAGLRAYQKVLHFIGYRPRTEYEVRRKIQALGCDETLTEDLIARLYRYHYLDDAQYALAYARNRLANKGYGPRRVQQELARKGIPRSLAESALAELVEPDTLLDTAKALAEKRWDRLAREPDARKRRKKVSDYLMRRGYTWDTIKQVLDGLAD